MTPPRRASPLATLGLLAMTAVWGSTFVLIKDVVGRMPVADFLAVRFALAALAMLALFARPAWRLGWRQSVRALLLGLLYGAAQLLQTWGLKLIAPSVSGFVTGMYVVFTPLLATVLLRQRPNGAVWLAVLLATAGLALLSLNGFSVDAGVWLTLASAALYALHIVGLGQWSRPEQAPGMSAVQMVAIAAVCLLATAPHGPQPPPDRAAWLAVLYMALVAGAGAMLVQTWAQAHLPATRAAIVMTTEPVFAAGFAVALGVEAPTWRMVAGGALVLAAMYLVELAPRRAAPPPEALHHEV
ncbi:DMT family transporter [Fulvimonas soli]|uniref:Threonine/homoserine efflux transporter RhtA n=1 Tax=Fulvimonas soli TaxID=155197 RepID=A0A316I804_9GAMM|nr:DMT family transporter [Fulvimonas soli]PWK88668.1 threonine/homoserine efflux transporter RhtA [Fulvimonas soli]TNY26800.1 EamA family transporter [Fulvimonas soli]